MNKRQQLLGAMALALTFTVAGCASAPRPVEEMSRARTLIEQADQAGAQQFAAADLQRAREHLHSAEAADKEKDGVTAKQHALQASADAELAAAKARQGKAEQAAKEVQDGVSALDKESSRSADQKEEELRQPPQQN